MGVITRALAVFSPKAALKRQAYENALSVQADQSRGYAGASRGRRSKGWTTVTNLPADEIIRQGGALLRDRARDLVRNNPHAANAISKHADNIVGDGIVPKPIVKKPDGSVDEAMTKKISSWFEEFSDRIDPEGQINFYGQQHVMVRGTVEGGEMLARRRNRRRSDNLPVLLQVQLLEPEFLDDMRTVPFTPRSTNRVRSGIEFDAVGGRRGYWLHPENPRSIGFGLSLGLDSKFVPASEIAHLYERKRTQIRGETWLAPVINRLQDLDDYDGAERLRKKIEACLVGVVTPGEDEADDENPNEPRIGLEREPQYDAEGNRIPTDFEEEHPLTDVNGDEVERMEPGAWYFARSGSKVTFNTPAASAGYDTYTRTALKGVAAGLRMPYEVLSGDLSEVSYASGRMGRVEYRNFVNSIQWNVVIPMFCQPVWEWFIDTLKLQGLIDPSLNVGVEWTVPAVQSINPIDDVNADTRAVRSGFMSWPEAVIRRGGDPEQTFSEIVEWYGKFKGAGIVLDVDASAVSQNGQKHQTAGDGEEGEHDGEQAREVAADKR